MEIKEIQEAIENASKAIKEKAEGAASQAADALEKAKSLLDDMGKKASSEDLEKAKNDLEEKIKGLQTQADKLSAKVNSGLKSQEEPKLKSFEERLKEAVDENHDELQKFINKEKGANKVILELKAVGDMSTGNVTGGSRYGQLMRPGIIPNPSRKVYASDLLQQGSIGPGNTYTFMREDGEGEGAIAPTAEGATKPQFDLDLVEATVPVETIAGWLRVTRKAMQNIPGFLSWLNIRIPDKFKKVLDYNALYGTGTNNELKGILTAGNHVELPNEAVPLVEKLIDAITLLEDTYERDANIGMLRPAAFNSLFKNKADGSGEYDLPPGVTIGVDGVLRVLNTPFYKTTALQATDFLVGDDSGAQLLTQNSMRIEIFEQDGDNVRTNKVTIRVEGDYALPVYGPNYFVKGTVGAPVTP